MGLFSSSGFKCGRCGRKDEQMAFAPFPNELGARIYNEICQTCWKDWLQKQNQLINHFGLDVSNPDSHDFLFDNLKIFLFDEGVDLTQIDSSKEGSVKW
jgi:Fe-S cluster biosynthesis and repair protein YggX